MKIAIISDIHANYEALKVALDKINELKAERIICLGDMVDYCADPNECVALVIKHCDKVILGNHDEAQYDYDLVDGFGESARISSIHTRSIIKPEYLEYFKTLPYTYELENLFFVHGSPMYPESYSYVLNEIIANQNFKEFKQDICFIGHSHIPIIFKKSQKKIDIVKEEDVVPGNHYIINVGSIGQPRDRNPRLSFGFFDTLEWKYKNIRLEYDTKTASNKIKNENLPLFLAERIILGV